MIRASVAGASGYGGGELLRLLEDHPEVEVTEAAAGEAAGRPVGEVWPHLRAGDGPPMGVVDAGSLGQDADVVFLALPAGLALEAAPAALENGARVVDLGGGFRLRDGGAYERWYGRAHTRPELLAEAVYGLPELGKAGIRDARLVASPGCYATAAVLALAPLVAEGVVGGEVIVDGKSGVSGAGRTPARETTFGEVDGNVRPYAVTGHRHTPEIEQALRGVGDGGGPAGGTRVRFVPHVVPMTRGLLATCHVPLDRAVGEDDALELYRAAYAGAPFVRMERALPQTKATAGSNFCDVSVRLDARRRGAVALAALDNLGKGAAGQAVQNMNLMFGLDEREGLWTTPVYP